MIGHFIGKETKVLELSKREEETVFIEFERTAHFLGGYLAISYLLHALCAVLLHGECVVTSTYARQACLVVVQPVCKWLYKITCRNG